MTVMNPARLTLGFAAGFLATLVCHQPAVAALGWLGMSSMPAYNLAPTVPFGVPSVVSLAFWGGIWGAAFALFANRLPGGSAYWVMTTLLGAALPSLVALLLVAPLKGGALGAGWQPGIWLFAAIVNGAWGLGTGFLWWAGRRVIR
jgi:hypothetical protein